MTKTIKTALLVASATAAATIAVPAVAASSEGATLVVDFNALFANSAAGKSGTQQLQTKYQATVNQRQAAFRAAAQAFETQRNAAQAAAKPGQPVPAATQQSLQQAAERAQQAQDALQQTSDQVNQSANYVKSQIIQRAGPLAEQIRAERKASVVISKDATLAADPADDVTTLLVQRLDASFPTPSITPPAQGAAAAAATPTTPTTQGR